MKDLTEKKKIILALRFIFPLIGAIFGYVYSKQIGCSSGCAIIGNPAVFTVYCAVLGFLLGSLILPNPKKQ
ncbi:MAG: hypothetical protein ACOX04_02610 [Candidatus Scatomorpha sp.]|jgi:hypothetical protein